MENELGDVIGKGKTEEEAFSSALLNLYKNQQGIEKILKKIQELHTSIENYHPVIFPMKTHTSTQESDAQADEFSLVNAGVFLEDKKAVLFPAN